MNLFIFIIFSAITYFLGRKYVSYPFFIIIIMLFIIVFFVKNDPIIEGILWGVVAGSFGNNSLNKKSVRR